MKKVKKIKQWLSIYGSTITSSNYKEQTIRNRKALLAHIESMWGECKLKKLKPQQIIQDIATKFLPEKASTAQRVIGELREMYSQAVINGYVNINPAMVLKLPKYRVAQKRLALNNYLQMLESAKTLPQTWVYPMLLLAVVTGQRRADLAKMKFSDIHDGYLHIEQQKEAGKGFGAKVALPLHMHCNALNTTLQDVINLCKTLGDGDHLLRKPNGHGLSAASLSVSFATCIRNVMPANSYKATEWPSLHECRSLSARLYTSQKLNVQTLLGHSHAEMTALYVNDRGLSSGEYKRVEF